MGIARALALFALTAWASQAVAQTDRSEQELTKLEHDWAAATVARDVATLDRILADELVSTSADGKVETKAQLLANVRSPKNRLESFVVDDIKVLGFGDLAVVTGRATTKGLLPGFPPGQMRFTDTFVKRDGRWQCIATQATPIAKR
jgi:ketosteroid isomerase-like protein